MLNYWQPLKTRARRAARDFYRQSKQKYARIVDPMRRIFVTNDGKSTADSSDVEFLEVAYCLPPRRRGLIASPSRFVICANISVALRKSSAEHLDFLLLVCSHCIMRQKFCGAFSKATVSPPAPAGATAFFFFLSFFFLCLYWQKEKAG